MSMIARMAAPISCLTIVGLGIGLSIPLLTLEMEAMGISGRMIGANTAVPAIAAILLAPQIPRLAARFGTSNLLLAALIMATISFAMFMLPIPFWLWFPIRFLFGAAIYGIFVISEYWINTEVEDHNRAFILGIYATILSLGVAAGTAILTVTEPGTPGPYIIGILIFLIAIIPILIWHSRAPKIAQEEQSNIFRYLLASPTSALAAFTFGALETGSFSLLAVYALRHGYSVAGAAFAISMVAIGSVFFQIPLGYIADRVDRRLILIFCGCTGMAGALSLPLIMNTALLYPVLVAWGGIVVGLYTVGLAHLGAKFSGPDLLSANSLFILMYAVGSLISPALIGTGMDIWNPEGYIGVTVAFIALFLLVAVWRWIRNPAIWRPANKRDSA